MPLPTAAELTDPNATNTQMKQHLVDLVQTVSDDQIESEKRAKLVKLYAVVWLDKKEIEVDGIINDRWFSINTSPIEAATAIKHVELINADTTKTYRVSVFCNADATHKDRISISDSTETILTAGANGLDKSTTGLTKVTMTNGSVTANLWVDYREITTTGVLYSSIPSSPMVIAKSNVVDVLNARLQDLSTNTDAKLKKKTQLQSLYDDLHNPLLSVNIKLVGDSITWGSGASNRSPFDPRNGTLADVRNTTDPISPSWANLLRQWLCSTFTDGNLIHEGNGSAYAQSVNEIIFSKNIEYFNFKKGEKIFSNDEVKALISSSSSIPSGEYFDLYPATSTISRPLEISFVSSGSSITLVHAILNNGTPETYYANVYIDGVFSQRLPMHSTSVSFNHESTINLPDNGKHVITIRNEGEQKLPVRLQQLRVNKVVRVANDGINGSTTHSWLATVKLSDSIKRKDDYVFVQLGTNNRINSAGRNLNTFSSSLVQIIKDIYTLSDNNAKVILMSANAVTQDESDRDFTMRVINNSIKDVADQMNVSFISNFEVTQQLKIDGIDYTSDGLHPNDTGYRVMFENIRDHIIRASKI